MEAPEKIYLQEPIMVVRTEKAHDNDIEYTRTDVFIEKTCEWIKTELGYRFNDKFIGLLIDDFKKYMKGD